MKEFSLEEISEKIYMPKTKEYFLEVISSYQNSNFRSAVVMLWSVTVCDIVYKLQYLYDLYADAAAKSILDEITQQQNRDSRSSTWEIKLIEDTCAKTNLLGTPQLENLRYLQKQRHIAAHPILNGDRELHSPNKETTRALLRNVLDDVLTVPPYYAKGVSNLLIEDLADNAEALNTRDKVKRYLESAYLNKLKPETEIAIFRFLWKMAFKAMNDKAQENRRINTQALLVVWDRNKASLMSRIEIEKDYYSRISSSEQVAKLLINFLARCPEIYSLLSGDAQIIIKHAVETVPTGSIYGFFVKKDLSEYYTDLELWLKDCRYKIDSDAWKLVLAISDTQEWQGEFCKLLSTYYTSSVSYKVADSRFGSAVEPFLYLFERESLLFLLNHVENNPQTYGREAASFDHFLIKQRAVELSGGGVDIDLSEYPNFSESCGDVAPEEGRETEGLDNLD
ncbi:MAG: hypothetical protein ACRBCK_00010 [Alphaproteobacteria bacterium]